MSIQMGSGRGWMSKRGPCVCGGGSTCLSKTRALDVTVLWVQRPHVSTTERDPRVCWFVWRADPEADVDASGLGSVLRFRHEHGSGFQKQSLLWDQSRVRTSEPFERWTHLVAARDLVEPALRPWESTSRPATPHQVHRAMGAFVPSLGTPARHSQPRATSPGRAKGATIGNAKCFSVVKKTPQLPPLGAIELFRSLHHRSCILFQTLSSVLAEAVRLNEK